MKTHASYQSQRAHGGRGGKYGTRKKSVALRANLNVRIYAPMIRELGKVAYVRAISTSRLLEMAAFKIITEHDAEAARRISASAGDLFPAVKTPAAAATGLGRQLDKAKASAKRPFLDINNAIEAAARTPAGALAQLKAGIQSRMADWEVEKRRRAAEEERKKQDELCRLEEQRKREAAAVREAAELAAALLPDGDGGFGEIDFADADVPAEKTETEKQIEAVKYAPAAVSTAAPAGVAYRTYLRFAVVDVAKLPEQFTVRSASSRFSQLHTTPAIVEISTQPLT
jgi:hypothetical protein